ncbi:hypothetical protein ABT282_30890 [Streptomyces sp. NPDC000927]
MIPRRCDGEDCDYDESGWVHTDSCQTIDDLDPDWDLWAAYSVV